MHRLDPRTRLALWLMATVAVLSTGEEWVLALEAAVIILILPFLGIFARWISSLKLMLPFAALVFLTAVISLGLSDAFFMVARLVSLLTLSFILFQKVTVDEMGESARKLGMPHGIAFLLTASMRYVPLLGERLSSIMDAQRSRGIDLRPRLRNLPNFLALAVPLLIQAILLSENLAMAMEARGFSRKERGCRRTLRLSITDYAALALGAIMLAVLLRWGGLMTSSASQIRYAQPVEAAGLKGCFTLIVGDVNTGKTHLSRRILETFLDMGEKQIMIVDLAPDILQDDLAKQGGLSGVGGGLKAPPGHDGTVKRLRPKLAPPRLRAKTHEEALAIARENAGIIERLLPPAIQGGLGILFVNDCSMYLQAGDPERFIGWIRQAETAVVNGYYGTKLGGGPVSEMERRGMEYLMGRCDRLIRLQG